jgi:dTDP-4-amino-4,6-dideoxygalactose transaminase
MEKHDGRALPNADRYATCLIRLPVFFDMKIEEMEYIIQTIEDYFG